MTQELKILQRKTPLQKELELYVFLDGALLNLNDCDPIVNAQSQALRKQRAIHCMYLSTPAIPMEVFQNLEGTMTFPLYPKD